MAELAFARTLLQPDEWGEIGDTAAVAGEAVKAWRGFLARGDVSTLLSSGRVMHEVPFSMETRRDQHPVILRGTIDCVVETDDGSVVIVEFKTGGRRPSHQRQLDLYVEAAMALFPGARVVGRLIYAD